MKWEKEIADELWELLPPDFQYKNVDRKTVYNWLRTRLESAFKQALESQMSDLRKEVESMKPPEREINYHQSYTEGKIDALDEVLLINK